MIEISYRNVVNEESPVTCYPRGSGFINGLPSGVSPWVADGQGASSDLGAM